jgi:hypothetical protein
MHHKQDNALNPHRFLSLHRLRLPALSRDALPIVRLWLLWRVFSWLILVVVAAIFPFRDLELRTPAWPPSEPLADWLYRLLISPFNRWDVDYYLRIVERGYSTEDGTAQFHPLFAWLSLPLAWLTANPLLGLILTSSVVSLFLFLAFERLALLDLQPDEARLATLLLIFSPLGFIFFVPYTEGLFLLCTIYCFLFARRGQWWLAGLAGMAATLTRQQGLFLVLPLAWELWLALCRAEGGSQALRASLRRSPMSTFRKLFVAALPLALIPGGMLLWLIYRGVALGDFQPDWSSPQALLYSTLISSSSSQVVPVQAFLPPWQALALAFQVMIERPSQVLLIDFVFGFGFLVLFVLAWPRMRGSYRIWSLITILLSFSYYTGPFYPYMGLPRHLLLAFPVFIGLAPFVAQRWTRLAIIGGVVTNVFLLYTYARHAWIP